MIHLLNLLQNTVILFNYKNNNKKTTYNNDNNDNNDDKITMVPMFLLYIEYISKNTQVIHMLKAAHNVTSHAKMSLTDIH